MTKKAATKIDPKKIERFFDLIEASNDECYLSDLGNDDYDSVEDVVEEIKSMVKQEPRLLECRYHGYTAMERLSDPDVQTTDGMEMLEVLVNMGAKATDACYDVAYDEDGAPILTTHEVLLCSGYIPGNMYLDNLFELQEEKGGMGLDDPFFQRIVNALHLKVETNKQIDGFNVVCTHRIFENLQQLQPKMGVHYAKDGPFDKFSNKWLKENGANDDNDHQPAEKKQRA